MSTDNHVVEITDTVDFDVLMRLLDAGSYEYIQLRYAIRAKSYMDIQIEPCFDNERYNSIFFNTLRVYGVDTYADVLQALNEFWDLSPQKARSHSLYPDESEVGEALLVELNGIGILYRRELRQMTTAIYKGVADAHIAIVEDLLSRVVKGV